MEKDEVEIRDEAEIWVARAFISLAQDVLHLCWLHIFLLLINLLNFFLTLKQKFLNLILKKVV